MEMTNYLRKQACLAVIKAMPDMLIGKLVQGRLLGLMKKLQKEAYSELMLGRELNIREVIILSGKINKWMEAVGWHGKEKHSCTFVSFLLYLHNEYIPENERIFGMLDDIFKYFDRVGKAPEATGWAGSRAAKLWTEIFGEKEE
uniref:Uncharacterized protein n=1 Tax=viral metagenome TaxID=1070528 RepID=A0A6M3LZ54_9ZZZZ